MTYIEDRAERDLWNFYYRETVVKMIAEGSLVPPTADHAAKLADALLVQWRLRCVPNADKS